MAADRPWIAAHEGYYGPPLTAEARVDLVRWLATKGYDAYLYAPKDDPFHRARWREPYPADERAPLEALAAACAEAGIQLGMVLSPGLDWRFDDPTEPATLTAKLRDLADLGVGLLSVQWDDVPGEGATVGHAHGAAVAAAHEALDRSGLRWVACPVDYATGHVTAYLAAFAAALPAEVAVAWTGPSVVSDRLPAAPALALQAELGRPLYFGENFPVNDLGMAGVLHLGPYPAREPALRDAFAGVGVNFMPFPLASRVGLAVAAAFWLGEDEREGAWERALAEAPGLGPLAEASRSWLDTPGPSARLLAMADAALEGDTALDRYLDAGCRSGLDPALAAEVEPWLAQWEAEAAVLRLALAMHRDERRPSFEAMAMLTAAWRRVRRSPQQVFGIRSALYPATGRDGDRLVALGRAVVDGRNLTDRVVAAVLATLPEDPA